jgi:tetratricopeptide (TPR) repeat protein
LEIHPQALGVRLALAEHFVNRGDLELARQLCLAEIRIHPDFADAHTNLGTLYLMMGESYLAIRSLRRSLELDPNAATAKHNLEIAVNAHTTNRKISEWKPKSPDEYAAMARTFEAEGDRVLAEAARSAAKADLANEPGE